eukprot:TRINITY_DN11369_c0_g1_i1.p1 TRINITY_DN11369_c0_g1~~TRINITY_DN11369_c0_g1_i1.p1  ORF type:complete len:103 (+),score=2.82 TRINITY_DN11369_c0_g1_i1:78-386(+)
MLYLTYLLRLNAVKFKFTSYSLARDLDCSVVLAQHLGEKFADLQGKKYVRASTTDSKLICYICVLAVTVCGFCLLSRSVADLALDLRMRFDKFETYLKIIRL